MARTRQTARRMGTPPPRPPRQPKNENVVVRDDLPTKEVERIVIFNDRMEIYWGDEGLHLEWKNSSPEELYPYWGDAVIVHQFTEEDAVLLCSKMTDLNVYKELHTVYCNEAATKMLLECFRPRSTVIWSQERFSDDFLNSEELKYSTSISVLSLDDEAVFEIDVLAIRSDLENVSIQSNKKNMEWQYAVLKSTIQNWILGENSLKKLGVTFPEITTVDKFERETLDGLEYEVLWRYNDHSNSLLKEIDIERFKEYEGHEAAVFAVTKTTSGEKGVVYVLDDVFSFVAMEGADLVTEVDGILYTHAVRWVKYE